VNAASWYVAGTWVVTGEHKHGRVDPQHPLLQGGIGAWEIAARVEALTFDPAGYPTTDFGYPAAEKLLANTDRVWTLGVNWYLNHNLKVLGDVITEAIDDPDRSPAPANNGRFTSVVFRLQLQF